MRKTRMLCCYKAVSITDHWSVMLISDAGGAWKLQCMMMISDL
jgi:hypothetical protein